MNNYLTKNELVVRDFKDAMQITEVLMKNDFVVMLSREEEFFIINWIWCSEGFPDRNSVIFYNREDYEWEEFDKLGERKENG